MLLFKNDGIYSQPASQSAKFVVFVNYCNKQQMLSSDAHWNLVGLYE